MNVSFFSSFPHAPFEPELLSLFSEARRLDAAIAFLTPGGTAAIRHFLNVNSSENARVVVSVRFPTNLVEISRLAEMMPGRVYIHLGYQAPYEPRAERGQIHSKIVLLELKDGSFAMSIGSHNWTRCGIAGHNLEAGVIIRCQRDESIVAEVQAHIEACARESELFDPKNLKFYKEVQYALHTGPRKPPAESFPGFKPHPALVIHAEDDTNGKLPDPVRLYIPVWSRLPDEFFTRGQRIELYLYPAGSLFVDGPSREIPRLLVGAVTMSNAVADAPVTGREVNCTLRDLDRPHLERISTATIPETSGERDQVVASFTTSGREPLPIFHSATQSPKLEKFVTYSEVDVSPAGLSRAKYENQQESEEDVVVTYQKPHHMELKSIIKVPNPRLYSEERWRELNQALLLHGYTENAAVPTISHRMPPRAWILSEYVYLVGHRFSKEALERIHRPRRLFE